MEYEESNLQKMRQTISKMFAPPEKTRPAARLMEELGEARQRGKFLRGFGAYTGDIAGLLTLAEQDICYGSGWNHAASKRRPDIGVYGSHDMINWAREATDAIRWTRHYVYEQSGGEKTLKSPFVMVDLEAGFGGTQSTFNLAYKLFAETEAVIGHIENQNAEERVCGHAIEFQIAGSQKKQPKTIIPRKKWLKKLLAAQTAAIVACGDRGSPCPGLILARTDSADGVTEDGKRTNLQDAVDDIIAAHEETGVALGWIEFNTLYLPDHLLAAEKILNRCPDMLGLFLNVSPNLYKNTHGITSKELADYGYIGQFSTIPANLVVQRAILEFSDEFKEEPFKAVLKLHERARQAEMYSRDNGIFQGQTWTGMDWWQRLKMEVDGLLEPR